MNRDERIEKVAAEFLKLFRLSGPDCWFYAAKAVDALAAAGELQDEGIDLALVKMTQKIERLERQIEADSREICAVEDVSKVLQARLKLAEAVVEAGRRHAHVIGSALRVDPRDCEQCDALAAYDAAKERPGNSERTVGYDGMTLGYHA